MPNFINFIELEPILFSNELDFFLNRFPTQFNCFFVLSRESLTTDLHGFTFESTFLVIWNEIHREGMSLTFVSQDCDGEFLFEEFWYLFEVLCTWDDTLYVFCDIVLAVFDFVLNYFNFHFSSFSWEFEQVKNAMLNIHLASKARTIKCFPE